MSDSSAPCIAAVKYVSKETPKHILRDFAKRLIDDKINVHGLLQENVVDADGAQIGVDAVDIQTNSRIPLLRPTDYELNNKLCSLDVSQLAEATGVLRCALEAKPDIVIVERFGKAESDGGGLVDELLLLMASGIPTLVSVSQDEWETWEAISGGLGAEIDCDIDVLRKWSHQILARP